MAALVEGCRYGLTTSESTSARKSIVHVKLTDSAIKSIEEFQKNKKYIHGLNPSIQFTGNKGELVVPDRNSSGENGQRRFRFTLAGIQGDPKGSFECISQGAWQNNGAGIRDLQLIGAMTHKVSVHATDEVYQATKERMKLAEDESKKSCAQEIKPRGPNSKAIRKKIVAKPGSVPAQTRPGPSSSSMPSGHLSTMSSTKPTPPSAARPTTLRPPQPPTARPPAATAPRKLSPVGGQKTATSPVAPPTSRTSNTSPVMTVSLRERMIHHLALRPYKKPELLARLHKDGLREKDRAQFGPLLKQVSLFNPRENSYSLCRHLYSDAKDNWPFYSDADKEQLKRRKASVAESSSSAHSPMSLSPDSSQASKRPADRSDDPVYPNKKQRIAHTSNQPPALANKRVKDSERGQGPKVSRADNSIETKQAAMSFDKDSLSKVESPNSLGESQENNNYLGDAPPPASDKLPDYIGIYATISSDDQRLNYKRDFNAEYEEYRSLHAKIEHVSAKFRSMVQKIRSKEKGSDSYEAMKNRIYQEYQQVKKDPKYLQQRQRCDYLYKKLGHIKKTVAEYDHLPIDSVPKL